MEEPISKKRVRLTLPGMDDVPVRRDVEFAEEAAFDLYGAGDAPKPAVILVPGYRDAGFEKFVGCRFRQMGQIVSLARLFAASGIVAVAGGNREPLADAHALVAYVRANAASLGIDPDRIAIWASSGNAPVAMSLLSRERLRCAAFFYPLLLDLEGSTHVADAAKQFLFANPEVRFADLPDDVPIFIARAGRDEVPHLLESLDAFIAAALARNFPITVVNHPAGPHAFDIDDDSETTRAIVRQMLAFVWSALA